MKSLLFSVALVFCAEESLAKEWRWTAYNVDEIGTDGKAAVVAEGSTCNYQTAISAGRKAAEQIFAGAFMVRGVDNEKACPKQVTTVKDEQK